MRYYTKTLQLLIILLVFTFGCNLKQKENQAIQFGNEENYIVIADTIINDVVVKNPNQDEWTDICLRNLDKKMLVDEIFKSVYSGKLIPHEFFNNEVLSINDIKALEDDPDFNRDLIAKVQFEEAWYFDPESQKMIKKVHSIMLAYEIYNSLGEIRGYKPAFKVYLK